MCLMRAWCALKFKPNEHRTTTCRAKKLHISARMYARALLFIIPPLILLLYIEAPAVIQV